MSIEKEDLKKLDKQCKKDEILYFLQNVIGTNKISPGVAEVICSHAPAGLTLSFPALRDYCMSFGWIKEDLNIGCFEINPSLLEYLNSNKALNNELIKRCIEVLFDQEILNPTMFSYDNVRCEILFHNEKLSLKYAAIRNTLISQGFFRVQHDGYERRFFVNDEFKQLLSNICRENDYKFTLRDLNEKLKKDAETGRKAEEYVLSYEKKRITNQTLSQKIQMISDFDVSAGYDLISYNSDYSIEYDRFIEVKAISKKGFYWSKNEYEAARRLGERYYLYLVDLSRIRNTNYIPNIIKNPAINIMKSDNWLIEADAYHIREI